MLAIRFVLSLLFICLSISGIAQSSVLNFKNYLVNDGLPSSQIYEIVEDHDGYIWFGTDAGLVKYNGYEFKTYTIKDGLSTNVIFKLCVDDENRIWCIGDDWRVNTISNGAITTLQNQLGYAHINPFLDIAAQSIDVQKSQVLLNIAINPTHAYWSAQEQDSIFLTCEIDLLGNPNYTMDEPGIHIIDDSLGCRISMFVDTNMIVSLNNQIIQSEPLFKLRTRGSKRGHIDFVNIVKIGLKLYFTADGKIFEIDTRQSNTVISQVWENENVIWDLKKDSNNNIYISNKRGDLDFFKGLIYLSLIVNKSEFSFMKYILSSVPYSSLTETLCGE